MVTVEHYSTVKSLAEIERAVEKLPVEEQQELMLFLGAKLRAERAALPAPRRFSSQQIRSWISEDETDLRRLREQS